MSAIWGGICRRKKVAPFYEKELLKVIDLVYGKDWIYHKWQKNEYTEYVCQEGFHVVDSILVKGNPLSELPVSCLDSFKLISYEIL